MRVAIKGDRGVNPEWSLDASENALLIGSVVPEAN